MKLLILGGSGRTGRLAVEAARRAGHDVTVLVRDAAKAPSATGIRVIVGDATSTTDVRRALAGQDALISALGVPTFWSRPVAAPAARVFVPLAEQAGARRVVMMSAFGIGETSRLAGLPMRIAFATVLRRYYGDKTEAERVLQGSALDWTIVQPVVLADGPATGHVTATASPTGAPKGSVRRADVAELLVACLSDAEWSRRTVVVSA